MWLFTPAGFFSIVSHRDKKKTVLVRARCRDDLVAFRKRYCKRLGGIYSYTYSDYPYRAECSQWAFAHALLKIGLELTYTNFKSAVRSNERHDLYMQIWRVLRDGERSGAFGKEVAEKRKSYTSPGAQSFGGHVYVPPAQRSFDFVPKQPAPKKPRGFLDEDGERGLSAEDLTERDWLRLQRDPFFWRDEMGHSSPDDEEPDEPESRQGSIEFDSLDEVIDHFKKG